MYCVVHNVYFAQNGIKNTHLQQQIKKRPLGSKNSEILHKISKYIHNYFKLKKKYPFAAKSMRKFSFVLKGSSFYNDSVKIELFVKCRTKKYLFEIS